MSEVVEDTLSANEAWILAIVAMKALPYWLIWGAKYENGQWGVDANYHGKPHFLTSARDVFELAKQNQ